MPRFYVNLALTEKDQINMPEEVARHILVLRLRASEEITLFNGDGNEYVAIISKIDKKSISVVVQQQLPQKSLQQPLKIDLLLCIISNDKMDLAIQKAVELGVTSITPIISERSQKLIQEKFAKRMEHWQKIIISSCEQCGNNILPQINLPTTFNHAITNKPNGLRLILSPRSGNTSKHSSASEVQLLIGPEGGFSSTELEKAQDHGFLPVQLGNLVLRSETAVIVGLTYIQLQHGSWYTNIF